MAIRARAGATSLHLRNTGRIAANPPIVFPAIKPGSGNDFSWGVWVKSTAPRIPHILAIHSLVDGSQMVIGHDGVMWNYSARSGATGLPSATLMEVKQDTWTYIGLIKKDNAVHIFSGYEDITDPSPWTDPVILTRVLDNHSIGRINAEFDYFMLRTNSSNAIAGFKFWNVALTPEQMQAQSQTWHGTVAPQPFWVSPLRVPGDLSNVQYPYAAYGGEWDHGHAYTTIDPINNLIFETDPAYIANSSLCNAWIYPTEFSNIFIDPGLTPLFPTVYGAPQFYYFADVGAIPTADHQIQSIIYYGVSFNGTDPGTPFTESWGLYKDELLFITGDMGNTDFRFVPGDTGVVIPPGANGPPRASTVYLWQFGAQFKWNPVTPQGETNTAHHAYILLYVTYIGYPSGIPRLQVDDMAGLFAIKKEQTFDKYNRGVERAIPQPTIRTAYIGE